MSIAQLLIQKYFKTLAVFISDHEIFANQILYQATLDV